MGRFARVGDIAEQVRGVTYAKNEAAGTPSAGLVPLLRAGNITDQGVHFDDLIYVPQSRVNVRQTFQAGDVLIAASSGSLDVVGKAARLAETINATFGAFCKVLRPSAEVDSRYFAHYFQTPTYRSLISSLAAGANINNLRNEHLDDLRIPVPPIDEQRRIADILDRADAVRAKRREALTLLDDLTQSIFLDLFGGAESDWPTTSVGELADAARGGMRTGPFGSQLLHSEFSDSGIAVLGIDNAVHNEFRWGAERYITETKYKQLRRYTVQPGDVLITIMGTCGRAAIVPDDILTAINTKHLCCISVDRARCSPEYLHAYFLRHPDALQYLQRTAKGAIMSGLNMGIIKAMPIVVPPMDIQSRFIDLLTQIKSAARTAKQSSEDIDELFGALQQRAFAGLL